METTSNGSFIAEAWFKPYLVFTRRVKNFVRITFFCFFKQNFERKKLSAYNQKLLTYVMETSNVHHGNFQRTSWKQKTLSDFFQFFAKIVRQGIQSHNTWIPCRTILAKKLFYSSLSFQSRLPVLSFQSRLLSQLYLNENVVAY